MRLSPLEPADRLVDATLLRSARRDQGSSTARFAAALGRYAVARAFLVFSVAAVLAACGTSLP